MMESLMSSDAAPFLVILFFWAAVYLFARYWSKDDLGAAAIKPAGTAKKKRRPVATS
jgi:hypothetical protein